MSVRIDVRINDQWWATAINASSDYWVLIEEPSDVGKAHGLSPSVDHVERGSSLEKVLNRLKDEMEHA